MTKRIFIGIKIPYSGLVQQFYSRLKESLIDDRINWVKPENIHLTLLFIGETAESEIVLIKQELAKIKARKFILKLGNPGIFKRDRKPRVIWLDILEYGNVKELKYMVDRAIENSGIQVKPENDFKPHVTLGRIKYIQNKSLLSKFITQYSGNKTLEFEVDKFTLFESILSEKGPTYRSLLDIELIK
ncbi:RNA 2',3'-cyclic phosphodiesterase [Bacteroidota bacterium]